MAESVMMGIIIVLTFFGIGVCMVAVFLGITLIKKKWPDVWQ